MKGMPTDHARLWDQLGGTRDIQDLHDHTFKSMRMLIMCTCRPGGSSIQPIGHLSGQPDVLAGLLG